MKKLLLSVTFAIAVGFLAKVSLSHVDFDTVFCEPEAAKILAKQSAIWPDDYDAFMDSRGAPATDHPRKCPKNVTA